MNEESSQLLGGLVALALFKNVGLTLLARKKRKEYVGKVSQVLVYPVKSVRELPGTDSARLTKHGVKFEDVGDRHWMVSSNGDMFTMKQSARLTLITSSVQDNSLRLDGPEMPPLILPLDPEVNQKDMTTVTCKNTPIQAVDCGDKAASWVSKVLQKEGLRLNYAAPSLNKRPSCKVHKDWPTKIRTTDEVAFQDFVHCMIMCESSMDELNRRLDSPASVIAFRPNLMIEGTKPFDEDNWEEMFIGDEAHVRFVDKCTRCIITTIDPFTGVKSKDEQPLKELKRFRCMDPYGPKPCMGIHTCVEREGVVKVGDPVYVIRK